MDKSYSLTRAAMYRELEKFSIDGKILDLGGMKHPGYHELIGGSHAIEIANIKRDKDVDHVFDAEEKFPLGDQTYDAVVAMNFLEHIFDYQNAVNESYRILKNGGVILGGVPFMHQVHGSPNDYFRYTKSALEKIFKKAGFKEVEVRELGTGVFGVIHELLSGLYRLAFIKEIFKHQTVLDKLLKLIKKDNQFSEKYMPLGYFFMARK